MGGLMVLPGALKKEDNTRASGKFLNSNWVNSTAIFGVTVKGMNGRICLHKLLLSRDNETLSDASWSFECDRTIDI